MVEVSVFDRIGGRGTFCGTSSTTDPWPTLCPCKLLLLRVFRVDSLSRSFPRLAARKRLWRPYSFSRHTMVKRRRKEAESVGTYKSILLWIFRHGATDKATGNVLFSQRAYAKRRRNSVWR